VRTERNRWLTAFSALIYAFLFAPIVVLIIFSFNQSRRNFVWLGFTTDWYPKLFANDDLLDALGVTLKVAVVAVIGATVLGSLLGLGLARLRFRGSGAVETLLLLPMVTPEIIMGISLLMFFSQLFGLNGSIEQISIAHVTFCISYVAVVVRARAAGMDPRLEEAARDLGASAFGAFRYVTLPLILPAVAAGAMLAFALSFDDLVVTAFNAGVGSTTLPIYIYSSIKFGVTPQINAISTIIVAVVSGALFIAWRLGAFRGAEPRVVADDADERADEDADVGSPPLPIGTAQAG
jgi:spermidine/putrescine transport system permease protein